MWISRRSRNESEQCLYRCIGTPAIGTSSGRYLELSVATMRPEKRDAHFSVVAQSSKAQAQVLKPTDVMYSCCGGDGVVDEYWDGEGDGNGYE